jgi:acyl-CoA synthetase (AMP-forming)/AMP-acid ligase II
MKPPICTGPHLKWNSVPAARSPSEKIGLMDFGLAVLKLLPSARKILCATVKLHALTPDSEQSIGKILEKQALDQPERDCLLFEGQVWNYRDFNAWTNRIANVLQRHGVRPGDTVGVLLRNCPELLACVAALAKIGAVAGMLNPKQRGDSLLFSIGVIKPKLMVIGDGCLLSLNSACPIRPTGVPWFWVGSGNAPNGLIDVPKACLTASTANPVHTSSIRARTPCYYVFTSGTTGRPKASVMTHLRWLRCGYGMGQAAMRLNADDIFYCPLPFYHNNALTLCWSSVLTSGAALVIARKFSASGFWNDIRACGATAFVYVGEMCRYLLSQPPSKLDRDHRVRVVVGNGLRPEIWDEFQQRFAVRHICEFYGSSEGNLAFVNALGLPRTAGLTMMPYSIVAYDTEDECPKRDANDRMHKIAVGDVGLLITEVSHSNPFDGYTDVKASEAKLLHNVFVKGDSWINSGDLVRDQGFRHIAFVDRVGDSFRWKSENVAATDVERAIGSLDGIAQVGVYGVSVPNTDGRAGMAAVVMQENRTFDGTALAGNLLHILPAYAVPIFVRVMQTQKTTSTFKIRKVELKEQGFNPSVISEPMFVLLQRDKGYEALTAEHYRNILSGVLTL